MTGSIDPEALMGVWLHSHEEDTETSLVYRHPEFNFPPSRGRTGFELRSDGTMRRRAPGPTDRTVHSAGAWRLRDGNMLELHDRPQDEQAKVLCVESVDAQTLVLQKPAAGCQTKTL